jgi:hypothetical protein
VCALFRLPSGLLLRSRIGVWVWAIWTSWPFLGELVLLLSLSLSLSYPCRAWGGSVLEGNSHSSTHARQPKAAPQHGQQLPEEHASRGGDGGGKPWVPACGWLVARCSVHGAARCVAWLDAACMAPHGAARKMPMHTHAARPAGQNLAPVLHASPGARAGAKPDVTGADDLLERFGLRRLYEYATSNPPQDPYAKLKQAIDKRLYKCVAARRSWAVHIAVLCCAAYCVLRCAAFCVRAARDCVAARCRVVRHVAPSPRTPSAQGRAMVASSGRAVARARGAVARALEGGARTSPGAAAGRLRTAGGVALCRQSSLQGLPLSLALALSLTHTHRQTHAHACSML